MKEEIEMWLKQLYLKESTIGTYANVAYKHIIPYFNDKKLDGNTINTFVKEKTVLYSRNYVQNMLKALYSFLDYLKRQNKINNIPTFPKLLIQEADIKVLTCEEQKKLMKYLVTHQNHINFGILLALVYGLRLGEVCALQVKDFRFPLLHISKTLQRIKNLDSTREKTKIVITSPKTKNSIRDMPITKEIYSYFSALNFKDLEAYILTGNSEKYMEPRLLEKKFSQIIEECHITPINFHNIRHSAATRNATGGMDAKTLANLLGHKSPTFALKRYVHPDLTVMLKGIECSIKFM